MTPFSPCRNKRKAFTLVEVAVSLAIAGFALISLLGILPLGLSNFRQARQASFYAEMVQTLQGTAQTTSFNNFPATKAYYFDGEGNPLSSLNGGGAPVGTVYQAQLNVVNGNSFATTTANSQVQANGANFLNLEFVLIYQPTAKILGRYPYIVGNSGN